MQDMLFSCLLPYSPMLRRLFICPCEVFFLTASPVSGGFKKFSTSNSTPYNNKDLIHTETTVSTLQKWSNGIDA